jgi:Fe-S-cluster containining protein
MSMQHRLKKLQQIYASYDAVCAGPDMFCTRGCALCCTANVTVTTLEAELILSHWKGRGGLPPLAQIEAVMRQRRFRPAITINRLAELCLKGMDCPDEAADPTAGPCPLLKDDLCSIYEVRPFGCRAMQSRSDCRRSGAADMPDRILSANTLFLQFIEALDAGGICGNLSDILLFLDAPEHRAAFQSGAPLEPPQGMPVNRTIPVLMIPPEHRPRLTGLARSLQRICGGTGENQDGD